MGIWDQSLPSFNCECMKFSLTISLILVLGTSIPGRAQNRVPLANVTLIPVPAEERSALPPVERPPAPLYTLNSDPKANTANTEVPQLPMPIQEQSGLFPNLKTRGRIEVDALFAAQSRFSKEVIGDLQNGYGFRRVRFGAQGTIGDTVDWVSEVELAGSTVRLRDLHIGFKGFPSVREIRIGNFREPYSLEGATSSNFITFMERSPLNELDPSRNWGICGFWWPDNERALFAMGVFRDSTSNGQSTGDENAWALTTRLTRLPVYEPDESNFRLVHLGAAMTLRNPSNGVVEFSPGAQSNLLTVLDNPGSPFLSEVSIPANSLQGYNLQAARVNGPFSMQWEWFGTSIQQTDAGVVFVHGSYFDASYFLTGEHRGYNRTRGAFDMVKVHRPFIGTREARKSGYGAVEVAARFAYADFSSPNRPPAPDDVNVSDRLNQLTLGVNWYLNNYTRFMVNYTAAFPMGDNLGTVSANEFSIRAAVHW